MTGADLPDPFVNLRALHEKVAYHWRHVAEHLPLHCARGCSACCYTSITISRIEADLILQARPFRSRVEACRGILDHHSCFEAIAGADPCPFLDGEGACRIYAVRPIICRSHGIPVNADGQVDICPLNRDPAPAPVLNLDILNATLITINAFYCRETGCSMDRVPLSSLANMLDTDPSRD